MEEITKVLKSCIVSHKGGIPQEKIDDEYYKFTGTYIPYLKLGYPSLYHFLGTVKEIRKERNVNNELVFTVSDPKTAHIVAMINNQKDSTRGNNWGKRLQSKNEKIQDNRNWKRKATQDIERKGRLEKRRKRENRIREWNQMRDRSDRSGDSSDNNNFYDNEYNQVINIVNSPQNMDIVTEPIVNGKQLIGDDFFLQLAIRNIGSLIWREQKNRPLHSGLCVSGQTIRDCINSLLEVESLANKVVILLGAEDIYKGHSFEQMVEDMQELLEILEFHFAFSRSAVTLCTIPPLANLSMYCHSTQLATLHCFNCWLREQTKVSLDNILDSGLHYNLIEFYYNNTNARIATAYQYFQQDARMVSGSSHPYVLWSAQGRRLAMTLIRGGS